MKEEERKRTRGQSKIGKKRWIERNKNRKKEKKRNDEKLRAVKSEERRKQGKKRRIVKRTHDMSKREAEERDRRTAYGTEN